MNATTASATPAASKSSAWTGWISFAGWLMIVVLYALIVRWEEYRPELRGA